MLVSINGKWKIPIGYFFQNKISAVTQAELIKSALTLSHGAGLRVWAVTCDGAYTNFASLKILGCKLENNYSDIQCWFKHPVNSMKIYYIPDACHMLKLARNTLGNSNNLKSNSGYIKWCYIEDLYNLQTNLTLKLANKLSKTHIEWKNSAMKVKYAAQTLSSSTSDALDFLRSINNPIFLNSNATSEYCRTIDRLFDFLNSRNPYSKGFKSAIFEKNISTLESIIIPLINYLYTLDITKNNICKPLHVSENKTFVLGFATAVKSMFSIAKSMFNETNFTYILTYKFSQDHIELLFARIRMRFGLNNNPNAFQFKTAIKQILIKNSITCKSNSNCNTFDEDVFGSIFDFKWKTKSDNSTELDLNLYKDISNRIILLNNTNSANKELKDNIIYYIVGYILRKIIIKIDCESCVKSLMKNIIDHCYSHYASYSRFVDFKNKGGLVTPSESAFKVVSEAEKMLLYLTDNFKKIHIKNIDNIIITYCTNKLAMDSSIFENLNCDNVSFLDRPHKLILITLLIKRYLSLRLNSFGKVYSSDILNPVSKRKKLAKTIIFYNQ